MYSTMQNNKLKNLFNRYMTSYKKKKKHNTRNTEKLQDDYGTSSHEE